MDDFEKGIAYIDSMQPPKKGPRRADDDDHGIFDQVQGLLIAHAVNFAGAGGFPWNRKYFSPRAHGSNAPHSLRLARACPPTSVTLSWGFFTLSKCLLRASVAQHFRRALPGDPYIWVPLYKLLYYKRSTPVTGTAGWPPRGEGRAAGSCGRAGLVRRASAARATSLLPAGRRRAGCDGGCDGGGS